MCPSARPGQYPPTHSPATGGVMEVTTTERERIEFKALREPTLCAAFQVTANEHADRVALRTKGDEFSMTWGEYAARIRSLAGGLAGLGLGRGDTIALLLTNRPEFHWVDAAAMHLGATPFSIYNTYSAEQIEYLVSDAQNTIVVTEKAYLDTIATVREACSSVEHVIVVDEPREGTLSLSDVEGKARDDFDFSAAWKAVQPDDVLTLIYTSGTTGPPKGVQITHENELSAGRSFDQIIQFPDGARAVSYLPMAHIAERSCTHYLPIMFGFTVTCCPDARQIIGYLPEVRPSWFFAVPRIFEKLKAAMEASMEKDEDPERRKAAKAAIELGLKKVRLEQSGQEVPEELQRQYDQADEQMFSKIRAGLGLDEI